MRSCACGCGESMDGKRPDALYASDKCRAFASDVRRGVRRSEGRSADLYGSMLTSAATPWAMIMVVVGSALSVLTV